MKIFKIRLALAALVVVSGFAIVEASAQDTLTGEEKGWLAKAMRSEADGWIHLRLLVKTSCPSITKMALIPMAS